MNFTENITRKITTKFYRIRQTNGLIQIIGMVRDNSSSSSNTKEKELTSWRLAEVVLQAGRAGNSAPGFKAAATPDWRKLFTRYIPPSDAPRPATFTFDSR